MTHSRPSLPWPVLVLVASALACSVTGSPTPTPLPPPLPTPIPTLPDTPGGTLDYDDLVADAVSDASGDTWSFSGAAGGAITLSVHGDDFNASLQVIAPGGALLAEDDDSGPGADPSIQQLVLPEDGLYQAIVRGEGGATGRYTLGLTLGQPAAGPPNTDGGFLRYDTAVRDQVSGGADDEWVFEGAQGDEVTISLYSDEFDTELALLDPDGATLFADDDGGPGTSSLIQGLRLTADGTYTILAGGRGDGGGAYLLSLVLSSAALADGTDGGPIDFGEVVEDVISDDDGDEWTFIGQAGDIVTIALTGDGLDTLLELYGPEGDFVAGDDDSGPDLSSYMENFRLPDTGQYTILALGYQGERGYYTLSLDYGDPPEARGGLDLGTTINDALLTTSGATWTFDAPAPMTVSVYLQSRDFNPALDLLDSAGELVASDNDSGPGNSALLQSIALPQAGAYTLLVATVDGFGGDYTLTLLEGPYEFPGDTPGGAITVGQTVSDTVIDAAGDAWTFDGVAGDLVTIALTSDEFDTYLELFGPGEALLFENDDDGPGLSSLIENATLPVAGTFTIVARGFGDAGGVYTLTLSAGEEVLPLGELSYGETVTGELARSAGDQWTFEGAAGDTVTIALNSEEFDTVLELRAPDRSLLASDDDGGEDTNSLLEEIELPVAGTYTIVAKGFGGGTGAYELTLNRSGGGASGGVAPALDRPESGALHAELLML